MNAFFENSDRNFRQYIAQLKSEVRALEAIRLRAKGLTYKEIGVQLGGVSYARARQLVATGGRLLRKIAGAA